MTTKWAAGGNLGTARRYLAGGGNSSDAICMGGYTTNRSNVTEEYNGSSWSSGGNLGTARDSLAGGGNSSDAICMGGHDGSSSSVVTEEYIAETVGGGAIWM